MKKVYLGNTELTTIATVTNGGGGGDDTQKWVDYFNGTLTEFTVPEGVTKINNATFYSFTGLTSLTLPSSITSIGSYNSHGMPYETNPFGTLKTMTVKATTPPTILGYREIIPTTISSIYVPEESVDTYKSANGWRDYADTFLPIGISIKITYNDNTEKTFLNLTTIDSSTVPDKAKAKTVTIYDGVTSIGYQAFSFSTLLETATIPSSVATIGEQAFYGCGYLASIKIKATTPPTLGNGALPSIISAIYVPEESVDTYKSADGWKDFADRIQEIIPSLKVTYKDGTIKKFYDLPRINQHTYPNDTQAKEIVLGDDVKYIGNGAFSYAGDLTSVTLTDSIKTIEPNAFAQDNSLTGITIPSGITIIEQGTFQGCSSLTSITIPSLVTSINYHAFYNCLSLSSVTIKNSSSKLDYGNETFKNISSNAKLYVPSNLLADYQADSAWTGAFGGGIFAIQ